MSANRNSVEWMCVPSISCGSLLRSHIYTYDAFGNLLATDNSQLATLLSFRFSTKYLDPETGFYYYGYRYYDPNLGRWLTRDPLEEQGGLNLYGFCGNDAVNKWDKLGNAYFALRALQGFPWLFIFSNNWLDDWLNTEISHEQLFFEDGKLPSNIGLFDYKAAPSPEDRVSSYTYHVTKTGFDDCIMRIAVSKVKPKSYSLLGWGKPTKYNCQDYAEDLRDMYRKLYSHRKYRKQCCIRER